MLHGTSKLIDDLCTINDDGGFSFSYKYIYPKLLNKEHVLFSDLDITIENDIFLYKLFDKKDKFPFFIVRMPLLQRYIPSSIYYDSIFSELLRIGRFTLRVKDLVPKASQLYTKMEPQGRNMVIILRKIKQSIPKVPWNVFQLL